MSKQNKKIIIPVKQPQSSAVVKPDFLIKYPVLWLMLAVVMVYSTSLYFGFTELDDSIFVRDFRSFNEQWSNVLNSFTRGVFDPKNDTYYRPIFLISMILNYQLSGEEVMGYHVVNILFHMMNVALVYYFFKELKLKQLTAFLMAMVFAIHPVLSQAVAWIPGRNDTLMSVFVLSFFISSIRFTKGNGIKWLIVSALSLLMALFTKETSIFAPLALGVILWLLFDERWNSKRLVGQALIWIGAASIYLIARASASIKHEAIDWGNIFHSFFTKFPIIWQYLGKIFLPFNLSVFPIQQDTSNIYGLFAIALLIALLLGSKYIDKRTVIAGFIWFFVFLLPLLILPEKINQQTFEHRLYLPIIGILLVLSQTALFTRPKNDKSLIWIVSILVVVLGIINYRHQQFFKDPLTFWTQAEETSPHSAYAVMMYGARVEDKPTGYAMMRRAYQLNPNEKYLNYYYGVMLQNQDSVLESEKYFLKEQKTSDYYECDFYLAQVSHKKQDYKGATKHLERYLTRDSMNSPANNNLLLLYLEMHEKQNSLHQIEAMKRRGFSVPQQLIQQANQLP
ncbi:MAG: glycosyltransferase family 39 protein [Bacteroidetes bacterium]|nr:glycosyltransferase family 39 protein [Bacteroidota bacterium]